MRTLQPKICGHKSWQNKQQAQQNMCLAPSKMDCNNKDTENCSLTMEKLFIRDAVNLFKLREFIMHHVLEGLEVSPFLGISSSSPLLRLGSIRRGEKISAEVKKSEKLNQQ